VVAFDAHVGAREDGGGQADEGGQGDQKDVQRIDVELAVPGEQRAAEITSAVSAQVARKVPRLKATLISRAPSRCPVRPRTTLPSRGMPRTKYSAQVSLP
jgi:hypothetical protein